MSNHYTQLQTEERALIQTMRVKSYAKDEDRSWWKPFDGMQNLKITEAIVQSEKTGQLIQTG